MSHPPTSLRIGIIGAGHVGEPLARLCTQAGHAVKIANSRGPSSLTDVAQRTGATAAAVQEAVSNVDVVIVALPQSSVPLLDRQLFSQLSIDTVIVDATNYCPARDGRIEALESAVESRWVEYKLGHPVIKALNNIHCSCLEQLNRPAGTPGRIALPVAGDNAAHKSTVMALIDQIGFDAVDAGWLHDSWRQQPGTPVHGTDWDVKGVTRALGRADRCRSHTVRDIRAKCLHAALRAGVPNEGITMITRDLIAEQYVNQASGSYVCEMARISSAH